jgi:maleate cis-trans isomerase
MNIVKLITATLVASSLAACSTVSIQKYTEAANATASVLRQIGADIVAFDCANASLIYVIAQDAGASSRVQSALAKNQQIAYDACPLLSGNPAIVVTTGKVVPAATPAASAAPAAPAVSGG